MYYESNFFIMQNIMSLKKIKKIYKLVLFLASNYLKNLKTFLLITKNYKYNYFKLS